MARTALAAVFVVQWLLDVVMSIDTSGALLPLGGLAPGALALYGPLRLPWVCHVMAAGWSLLLSVFLLVDGRNSDSPGLMELLALTVLLTAAARRGSQLGVTLATCGSLTLALLMLATRVPDSVDGVVLAMCMVGFVAATVISLGVYLRLLDARRVRTVAQVRNNERLDLARELHDFVAHYVTGIVVLAQAGRAVAEARPQKVATIFDEIEQAGAQTMDSIRQLVTVLREDGTPAAPPAAMYGLAQIRTLVETCRLSGPPVELELTDAAQGVELPPEVSATAHRIVAEGLTNVRKHAPCTAGVTVRVRLSTSILEVAVHNEAAPRPSGRRGSRILQPSHSGYGLIGLQERVRAVGGRLTSGPLHDGSWELSALLPVRDSDPGTQRAPA